MFIIMRVLKIAIRLLDIDISRVTVVYTNIFLLAFFIGYER